MEEDFELTVQHQRRVNPKIHDVIKQEVIKLLDAGLIYPISDSLWVSPVHCVPKKGWFTVVKNEDNELILTCLVTGWRVCIDYRKLNKATRKDHFPLPFMDQMLERLAGNQYYCFLDVYATRSSSRLVSNLSSNLTPSTNSNPKGRNGRHSKQRIEEFNLDELSPPIATMADQRVMAQLLQAPTEGYEDAILVPAITADNFELKHGLLTLVQNKQFFGHDKEDPHAHIRYFNKITSTLKFPNVSNTSIKLMLFPFFLEGAAQIGVEKEPPRSIFTWDDLVLKFINQIFPPSKITNLQLHQLDTFYNALNLKDQDSLNFAAGGNFLDKMPRECLAIIESKSKVHYSYNKPVVAEVSTNTSTSGISPDVVELKDMVKALLLDKKSQNQAPAIVKAVEESCYQAPAYQAPAPQTQGVSKEDFSSYVKANDAVMRNMQTQGQNMQNQLTHLTELITKFVNSNSASTSSSGTLPSNTIANPRKATKDTVQPTNNRSTKDVQPQVVQSKSLILTSEPVNSPTNEPVIAPVSAPKHNSKSSIPYPSRRYDERNREKSNNQIEKFYQIFKDMSFEISFADALILMHKFALTFKALIGNKEKLSKMAQTLLNKHCFAVLLKKLPKKVRDPGKFLIPCDFPGMAECLALADLGACINLMPWSVWKRLSLLDLTPTCMTLELANRSISHPVGVAEDVYVKVGELTLRVGKEAITFNLDQTSRYSANYSDMTAKRIDVIDMACEEYYKNDYLFEEVNAFFVIDDDPTSPEVDQSYLDPEGDILLFEAFLNDDPSLPHPTQGNYLPEVRKELKICEAKSDKSSIDESPEVELKDLPPHLKYAFLEGDDKLPIIIAKDLSVEEKTALITVLKSHKRAIAWKLSDIKGIDLEFCTHKILMEEDFEPAVQHQRRVNPKIHDVIKQEVLKLLDAGLIYPISDSPWVSPVHCVPKKGGFTIVENEDNELILTRLVTGWRVCIDYCKLNEATRKDHFPLPFMDQMLKRLAGNQYYCFLDGFYGYFQIPIDPKDQEKTTFTCPYGTNSFQSCLFHLEKMLKRCEDTNLCLNWEKSHFMVKEGIVLVHKISKQRIEVDKDKVDVITKLPHPITMKDTPFIFSKECVKAFQTLKRKLTEARILIAPNWDMPFELMCDASNFVIGVVLGKRQDKHFRPIHYASKTMTEAESSYTTTKKEMLAVVYAFEKFRSYLIMNKSIVYTDHSTLKYLFAKKDSKVRLLRWVLLLQEFTFKVIDTKGAENLAADHLS
nr:DNA-directed DNA polymerase [Tanacetum cinerariifolium]